MPSLCPLPRTEHVAASLGEASPFLSDRAEVRNRFDDRPARDQAHCPAPGRKQRTGRQCTQTFAGDSPRTAPRLPSGNGGVTGSMAIRSFMLSTGAPVAAALAPVGRACGQDWVAISNVRTGCSSVWSRTRAAMPGGAAAFAALADAKMSTELGEDGVIDGASALPIDPHASCVRPGEPATGCGALAPEKSSRAAVAWPVAGNR